MSADEHPDWMPRASAITLPDGLHRFGSTGQLWVVRAGQWYRIKNPTPEQQALADNPPASRNRS